MLTSKLDHQSQLSLGGGGGRGEVKSRSRPSFKFTVSFVEIRLEPTNKPFSLSVLCPNRERRDQKKKLQTEDFVSLILR